MNVSKTRIDAYYGWQEMTGIRILVIAGLMTGSVSAAAASEIVTEVTVLQVERAGLKQYQTGAPARFVVNVPADFAKSLAGSPQSRTVQTFKLPTMDQQAIRFQVSSRVEALDLGMHFELTAAVTAKREIKFTINSRTEVRETENERASSLPVFASESVRREIVSAEGASVLIGGFLTEREARQLASMDTLRNSPIRKFLLSEDDAAVELVLVLTPHITASPSIPVEPLNVGVGAPAPALAAYTLQVGAFQDRAKAVALIAELEKRHQDVFIQETSAPKPLYRVRVGRLANVEEVKRLQRLLRTEGFNSFVSALR